jgi:hypothetical protein
MDIWELPLSFFGGKSQSKRKKKQRQGKLQENICKMGKKTGGGGGRRKVNIGISLEGGEVILRGGGGHTFFGIRYNLC